MQNSILIFLKPEIEAYYKNITSSYNTTTQGINIKLDTWSLKDNIENNLKKHLEEEGTIDEYTDEQIWEMVNNELDFEFDDIPDGIEIQNYSLHIVTPLEYFLDDFYDKILFEEKELVEKNIIYEIRDIREKIIALKKSWLSKYLTLPSEIEHIINLHIEKDKNKNNQ